MITNEFENGEIELETGETVDVKVANLPKFDENGMLLIESIPVSVAQIQVNTYDIVVEEKVEDRGIAVLMAEDAKEAYNSDDNSRWMPR